MDNGIIFGKSAHAMTFLGSSAETHVAFIRNWQARSVSGFPNSISYVWVNLTAAVATHDIKQPSHQTRLWEMKPYQTFLALGIFNVFREHQYSYSI